MEWVDEALVLSVRPHGETAALAELLTREHGRYLAMVHGGRSRKNRPVLQIGNHVDVTWKARLVDQLGHAGVTTRRGFAALRQTISGQNGPSVAARRGGASFR